MIQEIQDSGACVWLKIQNSHEQTPEGNKLKNSTENSKKQYKKQYEHFDTHTQIKTVMNNKQTGNKVQV